MARLIIYVATLTAFLLLADASIYRTTVVIDEKNQPDDCREELMRQQNLKHCQDHVLQEASTSYDSLDINLPGREHFDKCCDQLNGMSPMCICYGLKKAMQRMPRQRGMEGRIDIDEALRTASELPSKCGMDEPSHCRFGSSW